MIRSVNAYAQTEPPAQEPPASPEAAPPKREEDVLEIARRRFSDAVDADSDNRRDLADDLRWYANEQWTAQEQAEREQDGRIPLLTMNRFPRFVSKVAGEVRRNPPAIKVHPAEDNDVATADVMGGLIRSIEYRSQAKRVYSRAVEQAAACGRGHFQIALEFADDEINPFNVDVFICGIRNPLAVVWDPSAVNPDRSDARYCFVYDDLAEEVFRARFPDAALSSWAHGDPGELQYWHRYNTVRIANYWVVKHEQRLLVLLTDGIQSEILEGKGENDPELMERVQQAAMRGFRPIRSRWQLRKKVCVYLMSGQEILAGPIDWPGTRIPVFTVWGEEKDVGEYCVNHGLIRFQKDAQRVINIGYTAELEHLQMATKAPFIGTQKQFQGHEDKWDNAHRSLKRLVYTVDDKAPSAMPQRVQPPTPNGAAITLARNAEDQMKAGVGIYDAALGAKSNETSGVAIREREQQSDTGTFIYIDNLAAALQACGEALVEIVPKIYDTERSVRILGVDEAPAIVRVNDGKYDLGRGKYDVVVKVGPAFETRRKEAADAMLDLLKMLPPPAVMALVPIIAKNLDFPEHEEIAALLAQVAMQMGAPVPGQPGMPDVGPPGAPPPGMPPGMQPPGPPGGPPQMQRPMGPPPRFAPIPMRAPPQFQRRPPPIVGPSGRA